LGVRLAADLAGRAHRAVPRGLDLYETFDAETEHGVAVPDAAMQSNLFKRRPPE
jgi:hypothetical protein